MAKPGLLRVILHLLNKKIYLKFGLFACLLCTQSLLIGQNPPPPVVAPCNLTVDAGPDITICLGMGEKLNGSVSAGAGITYSWEPPFGLSNPNILDPTANPTTTTTYTLTATQETANLIVNGGFETGNIAPSTTSYTLAPTPTDIATNAPDYYAILSVPQIAIAFGCNPPIGAYTMVIHGSSSANKDFWCQTISVSPNTDYKISYRVIGIPYILAPAPVIVCKVNGTSVGSVAAPSSLCGEVMADFTWNSGAATSASICLSNATLAGLGSMCAIDDIEVIGCCVAEDEVEVEVYELEVIIDPPIEIRCDNRPITLNASSPHTGAGFAIYVVGIWWRNDIRPDRRAFDPGQHSGILYIKSIRALRL